jgi:glycerol uptake facilitator-like aquaporin
MSSVAQRVVVGRTDARDTTHFQLARKIGAEMVGTFALVFAGCGAIMVDSASGGSITHVGVGLTFGLVIMVMIYAVGHISGAHFNPAVSVAFAAVGLVPWRARCLSTSADRSWLPYWPASL